MKKIEAIIRPEYLGAVRQALEELRYPGMTVSEVRGYGKEAQTQQWRGMKYEVDAMPRLKVEIVAIDDDVPKMVSTITRSARTGQPGDGKIFVLPVEEVYKIRTGEKGAEAV